MFANVLFRLVTTWSKYYTGAFAWESLLGISGPRSRSRCIEMYLVYCVFYVCHLSPSGGGQDGLKGNEGQGWTQASTMVRVVVTCDSRPRPPKLKQTRDCHFLPQGSIWICGTLLCGPCLSSFLGYTYTVYTYFIISSFPRKYGMRSCLPQEKGPEKGQAQAKPKQKLGSWRLHWAWMVLASKGQDNLSLCNWKVVFFGLSFIAEQKRLWWQRKKKTKRK